MDIFAFNKNIMYKVLLMIIVIVVLLNNYIYAGSFIEVNGFMMYKNNNGEIAKDNWVWIDTNNDGMAECFRFDENGYVAKNYIHYDGKKTNELGQWIENGSVVSKIKKTGKTIIADNSKIRPEINEKENYINGNMILPKNMKKKLKRKIEDGLYLGLETLANDEAIDGEIINNTNNKYMPLSDIIPESGIIYSKSTKEDDIAIGKDGKIILGKNATNFITASNKFEKEVKEAIVFNGDIWKNCMEMKGNKSQVKFFLNQYNYMYFEISNENHTNETYRRELDATLSIYADDVLLEEINNFTDIEPHIVELDLDGKKTVTLKLTIKSGNLSERIFINNARFRKYD